MWSTLEQYEGDPATIARMGNAEWNNKPEGFDKLLEELELPELNMRRRDFLKLGGFASVLALAAGCMKPEEQILPWVKAPEEIIPGIPNFYASTCNGCAAKCGLLVKTREARPIKLEGNPQHPVNKGKLCARGQATIIEMYDPDRLRAPMNGKTGQPATWVRADEEIASTLASAGSRAVLVTGTLHGRGRKALLADFQRAFPGLRHIEYDALAEEERLDAAERLFGARVLPRPLFDKAKVTVLLASDPMADGASPVEYMLGIAQQRKVAGRTGEWDMGRLYAFEPLMTQSGMNADIRYKIRPEEAVDVALALATAIAGRAEAEGRRVDLPSFGPRDVERRLGLPDGCIDQVADDLWEARGQSLVYSGSAIGRTAQAFELHTATYALNYLLGNLGRTIDFERPSKQSQGSTRAMLDLVGELRDGGVDVVLFHGVNPAHSLPASAGFAEALGKARLAVSFNTHRDETGRLCDYILPDLHYLENWGDAEPWEGILGIQQPTIRPLWNSGNRAFEDSLISIAAHRSPSDWEIEVVDEFGESETRRITWHQHLMRTWERDIHGPGGYAARFIDFWFATLRAGVLELDAEPAVANPERAFRAAAATEALRGHGPSNATGLTLAAYTLPNVHDGRHANNPWLLELPDPVARVCWDNFVAVAPSTARELNLRDGDIIELTANGQSIEAPVRRHPGAHKDVLSVGIGWGRRHAGAIGDGEGFNAFALGAANGAVVYSGGPVQWRATGRRTRLADVQGHNFMQASPRNTWEAERAIVQVTNLEYYNQSDYAPQAVHHIPGWIHGQPKPDLWFRQMPNDFDPERDDHQMPKHKWVMAIDLNACNGCNACMVACQAENNIPVVGKREVLVGREMHWIRIDRYYKGTPDDPEAAKLPMLCQHCENAPCETVCPVLATVHSDEGLNVQVYNRCVGTRYCANNCPYKVRRFNFYQYSSFRKGPHENQRIEDSPLVLQLNPDHTVRTKGIMEKCTFCHQRIRDAKYEAKRRGENIPDGALQTACQQTCPGQAIHFGDERNPAHSVNKVRKEHKYKRGYGVLEEFGVAPSILYLAQIKNRPPRHDDVAFHTTKYYPGNMDKDGAPAPAPAPNAAGTTEGAPA